MFKETDPDPVSKQNERIERFKEKEMSDQEQNVMVPKVSYLQVGKIWTTAISDVVLTGVGSLKCHVQRPESGQARGGYVMVFKNEIAGDPIIRDYIEGRGSETVEVGSDEIEWQSGMYVLCYGPHYSDDRIVIATSVNVLFGSAQGFGLSACTGISHDASSVTSYYRYDENPRGYGHHNAYLIVREGGTFGEGREVGRKTFSKSEPFEGVNVVSGLSLKRGETYNVTTNLYSIFRPVAGYSFRRPI